jgi:hypothetical protein
MSPEPAAAQALHDPGRRFDEHLERVGAKRIWLATIDGEVVGMMGVIQTDDEIELEPIVVSEQWRGRGIGAPQWSSVPKRKSSSVPRLNSGREPPSPVVNRYLRGRAKKGTTRIIRAQKESVRAPA